VTQATPHFDRFLHWLQDAAAPVLTSRQFLRWRDRLKTAQGWLLSGAVLLLLLRVNWQFVLSIGLGLAVLLWLYLMQQGWWQQPQRTWQRTWQKLWSRANRSLTVATIGGLVTMGGSYVTLGIWRETDRFWLATGVILEGVLLVAVLGLLIWQMMGQRLDHSVSLQEQRDRSTSQFFADLSDADPLKRLIAIRHLTHSLSQSSDDLPMTAADLADCLRLMLNRETEPSVCRALLEGLQRLNSVPQLETATTTVVSTPRLLSGQDFPGNGNRIAPIEQCDR
jgi:hypothetical protein